MKKYLLIAVAFFILVILSVVLIFIARGPQSAEQCFKDGDCPNGYGCIREDGERASFCKKY